MLIETIKLHEGPKQETNVIFLTSLPILIIESPGIRIRGDLSVYVFIIRMDVGSKATSGIFFNLNREWKQWHLIHGWRTKGMQQLLAN